MFSTAALLVLLLPLGITALMFGRAVFRFFTTREEPEVRVPLGPLPQGECIDAIEFDMPPAAPRAAPPPSSRRAVPSWPHPVGVEVLVTLDDGRELDTRTRSQPFFAGDEALIKLEGLAGAYPLNRVRARGACVREQ